MENPRYSMYSNADNGMYPSGRPCACLATVTCANCRQRAERGQRPEFLRRRERYQTDTSMGMNAMNISGVGSFGRFNTVGHMLAPANGARMVLAESNFQQASFPAQVDQNVHPNFSERSNYSEQVRVPSSDHAAEIIGKGGDKIMTIRENTNTYIHSPKRGEEALFLITGTYGMVQMAKQEIKKKADHFTLLRSHPKQPCFEENKDRKQEKFYVQKNLVGLVVGTKGRTIKRIQDQTGASIITPPPAAKPYFQISGSVQEIQKAKKAINDHIYAKTGNNTQVPTNVCQRINSQPPSPVSQSSLSSLSSNLPSYQLQNAEASPNRHLSPPLAPMVGTSNSSPEDRLAVEEFFGGNQYKPKWSEMDNQSRAEPPAFGQLQYQRNAFNASSSGMTYWTYSTPRSDGGITSPDESNCSSQVSENEDVPDLSYIADLLL